VAKPDDHGPGHLAGVNSSFGRGINNLGTIVGSSDHAFIWTNSTGIQDLNTMLNGSGAGWNLAIAYAIRQTGFFAIAQPFNATIDRRFVSRSDSHDPPESGRRNPLLRPSAATDNAAMSTEPTKSDPPKNKCCSLQISLSFGGRDLMRLWTWLLSVFVASAAIGQERPFEREFAEKQGQHAATFEKASALSIDGDIDGAEKLLVGLTQADDSPAMCLLVGDALYNTNPTASYKLHKKAYDAMPDERTTVLEWGMERHRKQECAEAVPLYKKYLKLVPDDRRLNALLADCLVREGKPREAVTAWDATAYSRNHTEIDLAICEIYGDLSPPKRRGDLLKQIRKGKLELIESLFALDLDFDRDWWNGGVDQQALDRDLPFVERLLGKDSKRVQAIRCWLSIATRDEPQAGLVTAQLKQFGLIVEGGELPKSSLVAGRLLGRVLDLKIETPNRLFARFQDELLTPAKSQAGDVEALNILCNLCEDQKQRREEFERYGAERYGDRRFVVGLCALLMEKNALKSDSPELVAALKKFPENNFVNEMALRTAGKEHVTKEMLAAAIKSEYRHLSSDPLSLSPTSAKLNGYFRLLKEKS
jgi:hypothetical protein